MSEEELKQSAYKIIDYCNERKKCEEDCMFYSEVKKDCGLFDIPIQWKWGKLKKIDFEVTE